MPACLVMPPQATIASSTVIHRMIAAEFAKALRHVAEHQTGKRRVVVVMRERQGRTQPLVVCTEDEGMAVISRRVKLGSILYADEASPRDA